MKKVVNGVYIDMTAEEISARQAEEAEWNNNNTPFSLAMKSFRLKRNSLLAETDWMANSDVTMSDAWATYRQALRDITTQTPSDDELSNITFPTKPTE